MAGLEQVVAAIYHEKQQPGSMLCAQHALNSLLQGQFFTAPDLSEIAKRLDALEEGYDDANRGDASTNMDDTGFFSVQVLENALQVWGLSLVRWRSEQMRTYQDHPHKQLAFILNLEQHWFTLRRFGMAESDMDQDYGNDHWFNLNSFLPEPEWISKTYLGMVLQQSEAEGYSVFAVVKKDPQSHLTLPRTPADEIAATLPDPSSRGVGARLTTTGDPNAIPSAAQGSASPMKGVEGFEDEDMELQAALQASLLGGDAAFLSFPPAGSHSMPGQSVTPHLEESYASASRRELDPEPGSSLGFPDDPVADSMARNRARLEQAQREQRMALEELGGAEEDDENEMILRAIRESQASARVEGHGDDEEHDEDDEEYLPLGAAPRSVPAGSSFAAPTHRVYDDDDAELQAALKASMEGLPDDFVMPKTPEHKPAVHPSPAPSNLPTEGTRLATEEPDVPEAEEEAPTPVVDVDEMRRRRLAKFGG